MAFYSNRGAAAGRPVDKYCASEYCNTNVRAAGQQRAIRSKCYACQPILVDACSPTNTEMASWWKQWQAIQLERGRALGDWLWWFGYSHPVGSVWPSIRSSIQPRNGRAQRRNLRTHRVENSARAAAQGRLAAPKLLLRRLLAAAAASNDSDSERDWRQQRNTTTLKGAPATPGWERHAYT